MNVPLWLWLATAFGLAVPVAVDVWRACRPHPVGFVEAAVWSAVYVGIALLFGVAVLLFAGTAPAMEFFTGFVVEKALSVDNLFVFALVLGAFAVPVRHRSKVLLIGILGALAQRVVFIVAGAAALQRFSVLFLGFGVLLCYLAIRLLRSRGVPPDVREGRVMRWARRRLPIADGGDSLVVRRDGRLAVTGLGLAVLAILSVDLVFALDSVPAIFGITQNLYLVLCTNAFALLGLRALYFVLVTLLDRLVHLHYGLSIVLGLIGVKLVLHYLHSLQPAVPEIPTWLSLVLILAVFLTTTITSLRTTRRAAVTTPDHESARE
jgi:tellurite resistance protein TerC